jgi:hypothetical protein
MIDLFMGHIMVEGVLMKKTGIILALLMLSMTGLVFAEVEDGATCTILVSGRVGESTPVTAQIRSFNNSKGELTIRHGNQFSSLLGLTPRSLWCKTGNQGDLPPDMRIFQGKIFNTRHSGQNLSCNF